MTFIWKRTASANDSFLVSIIAPPFINRVAASGTKRTRKPSCYRTVERVARAVVLPAQGPPVRQILVIVCLASERTLEWSNVSSLILFVKVCVKSIKLELLRITPSALASSSFPPSWLEDAEADTDLSLDDEMSSSLLDMSSSDIIIFLLFFEDFDASFFSAPPSSFFFSKFKLNAFLAAAILSLASNFAR